MPQLTMSSNEAFETARRNHAGVWYHAPRDNGPRDPRYPGVHLWQKDFYTPQLNTEFEITRQDKIFTMGSCFARNLEWQLLKKGFDVPSYTTVFDVYERSQESSDNAQRNFTSKFNTFSILQQLEWGLDPCIPYPKEALQKLAHDCWADPHSHISIQCSDLDSTLERRRLLNELASHIRDCRIVILTLGLNEVWRDRKTGLIANFTPTHQMIAVNPDRFEFVIPTYQENISALERIHGLLMKHLIPLHQIVITVSPVALAGTYTSDDIVVANWHSKSLLLTAATSWARLHANVHYFPSFEIAYHSRAEKAWDPDRRHPSGSVINHIINVFLKYYSAPEREGESSVLAPS